MSFLARLFGRPPAPPPPGTVQIPEDLAARLTAGGMPLAEAVTGALRRHVEELDAAAARAAAPPPAEAERIPFWLAREQGGAGGIEEALRDRLERRRAAEADDGPADPGAEAPAGKRPRKRGAESPPTE